MKRLLEFGIVTACVVALGVAATPPAAAATKEIGKAVFVRGAATAEPDGEAPRILGRGATLYEGDVLRTARRSFAVLEFSDGTRTTLRPDTVFRVEEFDNEPPASGIRAKAKAAMRLFKGGLRMLTGLIGKRNREGFTLATPMATIGIRGTDFEARLCGDDCREEAQHLEGEGRKSKVVARVAFLSGQLTVTAASGATREASLGGSLFNGETLETGEGALAVVVFLDESRATLRENSSLKIRSVRYDPQEPSRSRAIMRFIRGGVRMAAGLIAKVRGTAFQVETPVATISARGTGFDLRCQGTCTEAPAPQGAVDDFLDGIVRPARAQGANGLSVWTWEGIVEFHTPQGTFTFGEGSAYFSNGIDPPVQYPSVPVLFQSTTWPATDPRIQEETLFTAVEQEEPETGLYVRVIEGDVAVSNSNGDTVLGKGESGHVEAADTQPVRLAVEVRLVLTPNPETGAGTLPSGPEVEGQFECTIH